MNILESLKDLLEGISGTTKAIVLIVAILAVLAYGYLEFSMGGEEPGKVINGDVNQAATQSGQTNTNSSNIQF